MVTFMGHISTLKPASPEAARISYYQNKVTELTEAGLDVPVLARSIGVGKTTVENWLNGKTTRPNAASRDRIDNICRVLHRVTDAGTEPEYAAVWMQTPVDEENFPHTMMDIIGDHPKEALKVVHMFFERPL